MDNPSTNQLRSAPFELKYESQILALRYFDLIESKEIIKMTEEIAGKGNTLYSWN